jgi:hypothetical protein
MGDHDLSRIAMACFVEGIDPSSLALSPGHLAQVEALLVGIGAESGTDGYYRCLESLASESPQESA